MLLAGALMLSQGAGPENLIPNGSFEKGGKEPSGWAAKTWQGEPEFEYAKGGRTGKRCVAIESEEGADASWMMKVPVEPFSIYRFSGWIKTEDVVPGSSKGALFNIHNIQPIQTDAVTGTQDWTRAELVIETGDRDSIQLNCLFGGWGLATGKAWFDDLQLEHISPETLKPSVSIDAGKTCEPISEYIYGQFIEHLGRCIYGGIWAEMLEDRKFFYAVDADESPWKTVGNATVEMVAEDAYVGEHTPRIAVSGESGGSGIVHGGLGLISGKEYEGHIVLAGEPAAAPIAVSLSWGNRDDERQTVVISAVTGDYQTVPFRFTAGADAEDGHLAILGLGKGPFSVGAVSLMPTDNVHGMRPDTLALLRELDSPIYRWPGGNFVSGYDWRDGIGDPDKRPPRKNPAWTGVEHNDFGLDEFMVYCRELGTEPLIVVNTGEGDVAMSLEELEYANGGADTPMGALRAENGHAEPYGVTWWGIGNEMYGGWQLGHMPLEQYVEKHNVFVDRMRAVDPSIKVVAVGATGDWSKTMLAKCADRMDALSEHFYNGENGGLLSHVRQIPNSVRLKADEHRKYHESIPSLQGKKIPIALDEWNYWYGDHVYGELGTRYYLKDALGIAAGIHEMARNSDVFYMANYAQTVNVIGCIKTTKTAAAFAATGLPLKLYRREFGVTPVLTVGDTLPLDVAVAWAEDRKTLTVGIVNPTREPFDLEVDIVGAPLSGAGRVWTITGPDPMAYNEPGKPPNIAIVEEAVTGIADSLEAPPISIRLYALDVK